MRPPLARWASPLVFAHMFNRLTPYLADREPPEDEPYGDFYVVSGAFGALSVEADTAFAIAAALDRQPPLQWIVFRDRSGSHVRVRTADVRTICESTAAQRAYDRRMARAREREERPERPSWEDD